METAGGERWRSLSDEMWISIFAFLAPGELVSASRVSLDWARLANDDSIWKYHYRKEWPWEASIFSRRPLCTAPETESHAAEPSSTATAPTATPPATSNEISCSACTFINPSHRSTCEMCETALPERPAVSVASQQQQRQRSEPTEERAQKRRVVEDTFDEVTLSPHLSPAFEATSAPPPTSTAAPAASTDVNDIFNTLFGTNPGSSAAKKHAKVNTSNPKQFRLPQPPVTVESRWKRLYFGKLKYEAQLFNRLDKTEDVLHSLQCTLSELYNGKVKKLRITRDILCKNCGGGGSMKEGLAPKHACKKCNGQGVTITQRQVGPGMIQQLQTQCKECDGNGVVFVKCDLCQCCNGTGAMRYTAIVEATVQPGMPIGQKVVLAGLADFKPGFRPGDLVFKIAARQPEPSGFQRIGHSNDLVFTQEITLADALWDCRFALTHLDGQQVLVNVPKTGQSLFSLGQMVMVKGQGMPIYSAKAPRYSSLRDQADKPQRGDLYVKFNVAFPSRDEILSDPEKRKVFEDILRNLRSLQPSQIPDPTAFPSSQCAIASPVKDDPFVAHEKDEEPNDGEDGDKQVKCNQQ